MSSHERRYYEKRAIVFIITMCLLISMSGGSVFAAQNIGFTRLELLLNANEQYMTSTGMTKPYDFSDIIQAYENAYAVRNNFDSTEADYQSAYEQLFYVDYNAFLNYNFVSKACEFAKTEQNYDNFYSEEDWNEFQDKIKSLEAALEGKNLRTVTNAFYDMNRSYNLMTNKYTLKGDVNGDGRVSVMDATAVQKYLVDLQPFTGAQKMLAFTRSKYYWYEKLSVMDATNIQKRAIDLIDDFENGNVFIEEIEKTSTENYDYLMERTFNFNICPRTADGLYYLDNGYYAAEYLQDFYAECKYSGIEP